MWTEWSWNVNDVLGGWGDSIPWTGHAPIPPVKLEHSLGFISVQIATNMPLLVPVSAYNTLQRSERCIMLLTMALAGKK